MTKDTEWGLRKQSDKSETVIEEQGANVLFLSFGFLEWMGKARALQSSDGASVLSLRFRRPAALLANSGMISRYAPSFLIVREMYYKCK
ncbi:MAG: DUF4011 domain-containing protein [Thermoguttaceae bacterium]|nr:DUF4011 domain-containing protein [Thermoguttaceae bacterium]